MVYVVLRDGRVLKYNTAERIAHDDKWLLLEPRETGCIVAKIAADVVERAEFAPPCRVLKRAALPKRPLRYRG